MRPQNDFYHKPEHTKENSFKERSGKAMLRRKSQLRAKLILINSAVALIVIMIVLICKVVSLNSVDSINSLEADKNHTKQEQSKKAEKKKSQAAPEATPAPTAVPAQTVPVGKDRWLRKNLDPAKPMVALTFDDGPYTPVTKRILATLQKYNEKATFFCVGSRVGQYSQMVQQEYQQGCQVASHTYGHVLLTKLKKKKILAQINKCNTVLQRTIGCSSTVLRPPGGLVSEKVRNTATEPLVCWSVDSEDWKSRNKKKVLKKCRNIKDGDIVLMHDLYPSTAAAVEKLVPRLKKKGFQLVTIDELFYYKGITLENGKVYYSAR